MLNGIGSSSSDSLASAMQRMQQKIQELQQKGGNTSPNAAAAVPSASSFETTLGEAVQELNQDLQSNADLPVRALNGELDLHEVTTQIKQTELAFQFSLQVRNKFIDAYREIMRMSV